MTSHVLQLSVHTPPSLSLSHSFYPLTPFPTLSLSVSLAATSGILSLELIKPERERERDVVSIDHPMKARIPAQ